MARVIAIASLARQGFPSDRSACLDLALRIDRRPTGHSISGIPLQFSPSERLFSSAGATILKPMAKALNTPTQIVPKGNALARELGFEPHHCQIYQVFGGKGNLNRMVF